MFYRAALAISFAAAVHAADFAAEPHRYWERPLSDPFTKLKEGFASGQVVIDGAGGELVYLRGLLEKLGVPVSSQALVFSNTSLQLRFISPRNPRALFFAEDIYVGYIPGARLEIVSLDPTLGAIFYIYDIPRGTEPPRIERSDRCMNCHAKEDTNYVPGLDLKSVLPGDRGGSLESFRRERTGHDIPLAERFGGWVLTGLSDVEKYAPLAGVVGAFRDGQKLRLPVRPGVEFDWARYPAATSDVLPQLLLEHQAGFVNRYTAAAYRTRDLLHENGGKLPPAAAAELDKTARELVRHTLFADEAALPPGGVAGDTAFRADFSKTKRPGPGGASLKDLDLKTRLLRYRCSYMVYASTFTGLPPELKTRVLATLRAALDPRRNDPLAAHLPAAEKQAIDAILRATLRGYLL